MMTFRNGYGFNTALGAVFFSDTSERRFSAVRNRIDYNACPWAPWGDDNAEPQRMADDIENCVPLGAGLEAKTRMAIGRGLHPFLLREVKSDGTEVLESVTDLEVLDWLERNSLNDRYSYTTVYNLLAYGMSAGRFILSKDRKKINRVMADDAHTVRMDKRHPATGERPHMYLSYDWPGAGMSFDPEKVTRVPLLAEGYELERMEAGTEFEFGYISRLLRHGRVDYARPLWKTAAEWIEFSRKIPAMKKALVNNQMQIKYVILISSGYWERKHDNWDELEQKERDTIVQTKYKEINDWLAGKKNAGKSWIAGRYMDPATGKYDDDVTITVVDDKLKDGKLLPDAAGADKQIMFSMFLNPAIWGGNLLGDGASGGAGSGSDIREAFFVQIMLMQQEREMNARILDVVKRKNGWADRLQKATTTTGAAGTISLPPGKLVFRYQNGLLTTLDSGGSTKSAAA